MKAVPLSDRLERESRHGHDVLLADESCWGWSTPAGQVRKRRRIDFLTAADDVPGRSDVLEVGCGTGTFTGALSEAYPLLTAIDISDPLLRVARERFPKVEVQKQDIHRTTFEDSRFDLVVGCSVLHHLEWDLALQEISRILKAGGFIRFSEPNLWNPQIFLQKNWGYLKRKLGDSPDEYAFTRRQILKSLSRAGFVEALVEPYEFLHPSTPARLIPIVERLEELLQKTPARAIAGSLRISARKAAPGARTPSSPHS